VARTATYTGIIMRESTSPQANPNSAGTMQPELASMLHQLHTLTVPNPRLFGQHLPSPPQRQERQIKQQHQHHQRVPVSPNQEHQGHLMRQRGSSLPDIHRKPSSWPWNIDSASTVGRRRSAHHDFETHSAALRAYSSGQSKTLLNIDGSPHVVAPPLLQARSDLYTCEPHDTAEGGSTDATITKNMQADSTGYSAVCEARVRKWQGCTRFTQQQRVKSTATTVIQSTDSRSQKVLPCQRTKRFRKNNGSSGSSSGDVGSSRNVDQLLPCGLTQRQINEIMTRELTPEDYELLLMLDDEVSKPQTRLCSAAQVERFPLITLPVERAKTEGNDEPFECGACLCPFEGSDTVRQLPCCPRALFHPECIAQWLIETKNTCPACLHEFPRED
jgi:hypothetical protein